MAYLDTESMQSFLNSLDSPSSSVISTLAMISGPSWSPAEGLDRMAVNRSGNSAVVSSVVGTRMIATVSPGAKERVISDTAL
jgi:hypothetical protein